MKIQEEPYIEQGYTTPGIEEQPEQQRRRRNPWFAIMLVLISIPLLIGGIGLLIFAGVTLLLVTVFLLVVGTGLLITAGVYFAMTATRVETRHFRVSEHQRIVVNNDIGTIHVNAGSDDNKVSIQATKWNRKFWGIPDDTEIRYEQSSEGDSISARLIQTSVSGFFPSQRVDFDIAVPRNVDLELSTNVGDIWVTGVSGQMSLRSDSGSIYSRQGLLSGNSLLSTNVGSINFHEAIDPFGDYEFATNTGSVNVILPADTAFHVDASTNLGNIATNIPAMTITYRTDREIHGDVGYQPGARMTLRSSIGSVNVYEESHGQLPNWSENESTYYGRRDMIRSSVAGGLAGGIFFFGLVIAILSGHFWTVLFTTLALTSLVASLGSFNLQKIYGGFQGFVFFVGLALCTIIGWWPWILVVLGVAAVLGALNGLWSRTT